MQVYIVGGAVRDQLLNRAYTDKDFVVVGATPQQMLQAGFIQVGEDFPVFLHPKTKEEYALARTERKSGKGYKGFEVYASPKVTIEEDLLRRDLTINAMAIEVKGLMDSTPINGEIIDPYNGQQDIKDKVLRHVSEAFSEDPLRVLRIARFYGRFYDSNLDNEGGSGEVNFTIAKETLTLIDAINDSGELGYLTAERVWQETSRALLQDSPQAYIDCLIEVGSLPHIMLNLAQALEDSDLKKLVFTALQIAGQQKLTLAQRWAILMFSFASNCVSQLGYASGLKHKFLDKADPEAYESWSTESKQLSQRLKVPKKIAQFNQAYINCYPYLTHFSQLTAEDIATIISLTKADKSDIELHQLLRVHKVLELAKQLLAVKDYIEAFNQISIVDVDPSLQGRAIGEAIQQARIEAIAKLL